MRKLSEMVRETRNQLEEEKWIQKAIKHKGALHKELHVPAGKKIPAGRLAKAAHAKGKLGKRARLAQTLKKLHQDIGFPPKPTIQERHDFNLAQLAEMSSKMKDMMARLKQGIGTLKKSD